MPIADNRARDRDALAFAARELVGETVRLAGDAEFFERGHRRDARGAHGYAVELEWQRHVLGRGETGEQVEVLEHVADRLPAQPCLVVARQTRHRDVADEHLARCRFFEGAGDREQGALAGPARAHDRDEFAVVDGQVDVLNGRNRRGSLAVGARHGL